VSAQLDSLLSLCISACSELESLDCLGDLPLLERLFLQNCKHLASLPGSHGNYTALRNLTVRYCPAINMKLLYGHFKRRLDSLEHKDLSDAGSSDPREGTIQFPLLHLVSVIFYVYCVTIVHLAACSLKFCSTIFCMFAFGNTFGMSVFFN
jgi:hypothetical protein